MSKLVKVDSQLAKEVELVLDDVGIDMETAVKMTFKRIIKEKSIAFLTSNYGSSKESKDVERVNMPESNKMVKSRAAILFRAHGIHLNQNVTFASKNKSAYNYWANPSFSVLEKDWYLILNDWSQKTLHLFMIPANAILPDDLRCRADQPDRIDLQICYDDPNYMDNRSKICFSTYKIKELAY